MWDFWKQESIRWFKERALMDMLLVGDDKVVMTEAVFNSISEYSATLPTGTPYGKIWKCHMRDGSWFMGEYYDMGSTKDVGIRWRAITVEPFQIEVDVPVDKQWSDKTPFTAGEGEGPVTTPSFVAGDDEPGTT